MSNWLDESFDVAAPKNRRIRFAEKMPRAAVLISAGTFVGRNYAGNPYPFRASSHFLYFMGEAGAHLAGTHLLCDDGEWTLFARQPDAGDALWHGQTPSLTDLAKGLNIQTASLDELANRLKNRSVTSLPVACAQTKRLQAELLGLPPGEKLDLQNEAVEAVIQLRLVHDDAALGGLREAAIATTAAHLAGMASTRVGKGEWEVRAEMEHALMARQMTTAYGAIVSTHGEVLHNHHHTHVMNDGDLLLVDVGAETQAGYAGDVTRTWPVNGKFSTTQREIYEIVLQAEKAAIDKVAPGVRYRDVHLSAARSLTQGLVDLEILTGDVDELVADDVHALFFPHGVGHLLGLDVHDMEDLGDLAGYQKGRVRSERFGLGFLRLDRDLEENMAITIEPGFYQVPAILLDEERCACAKGRLNRERLKAFADVRGIRIEDDIRVGKHGADVLTSNIPVEIADVERAVSGED
ncbi:MAG: aminopeptidase P family protein [Deltaproteobacteria bacterium]|nr:aminopeptidase P family protein [Deltaproteobacteria bacterium]